jgi:hypothetical protein
VKNKRTKQKTENRTQKTENRKQKTENRKQKPNSTLGRQGGAAFSDGPAQACNTLSRSDGNTTLVLRVVGGRGRQLTFATVQG